MAEAHVNLLDEEIALLTAMKATVEQHKELHKEVRQAWLTSLENHINANKEYKKYDADKRRDLVRDELAALKEMKKALAPHAKEHFAKCWLNNIEGDEKVLQHLK